MKKLWILLIVGLISGCNLVYKADIQQGNVLDAEDIERVEVGMSKRQVALLLGSPSISDPFHQDRWDYVATYAPRGTDQTLKQLRLNFERDELISIEGDYLNSLTVANDVLDFLEGNKSVVTDRDDEGAPPEGPALPTTPSDGDGSGTL